MAPAEKIAPAPQRGSVLMLVPGGVLVLLLLGAIAVDFSVAFLGQRELVGAAAAAANDAVTAALDERAFRERGSLEVDGSRAVSVVDEALTTRRMRGVEVTDRFVEIRGAQVCVVLVGRVRHVFAPALPGMPRATQVTGRAVATATPGERGTPVPRAASCGQ